MDLYNAVSLVLAAILFTFNPFKSTCWFCIFTLIHKKQRNLYTLHSSGLSCHVFCMIMKSIQRQKLIVELSHSQGMLLITLFIHLVLRNVLHYRVSMFAAWTSGFRDKRLTVKLSHDQRAYVKLTYVACRTAE